MKATAPPGYGYGALGGYEGAARATTPWYGGARGRGFSGIDGERGLWEWGWGWSLGKEVGLAVGWSLGVGVEFGGDWQGVGPGERGWTSCGVEPGGVD